MIQVIDAPVVISNGVDIKEEAKGSRKGTIAASILDAHNSSSSESEMQIKFDALTSHDITYVGIIQTARASGLKKFPIPYVLTNCHNSLCAVGGTINEDDHQFGLSAAKKYGGNFVPAHQAVIHQYCREMLAGAGKMILGSDSHTRYGALGTMAIGEGGPELVKQLLSKTYNVASPDVIAVYLEGTPRPGVGPQDVALAIIGKVFADGFVKNKVMEFVGPGIAGLSTDYRNGIDVMTTETTCLSSIWMTDDTIKEHYTKHGRPEDYKQLTPSSDAQYDGLIKVDLSKVECMIAMPFHPSNVYTVKEVAANPMKYLDMVKDYAINNLGYKEEDVKLAGKVIDGKFYVDQGVIAGCAGGTFENLSVAGEIIKDKFIGSSKFAMSAYPSSQPVYTELIKNGSVTNFMKSGTIMHTAFCGPCFGAGDTPGNNMFSIRHSTRNFPNREGSKPGDGQISCVALMDARSIAATAANGGVLTAATDVVSEEPKFDYDFDQSIYENRCYMGWGKADTEADLVLGPNIKDWPKMINLTDDLLLNVSCYITDPVTTTDELIPSGEASSYRSNPEKISQFTLGRKDPKYVDRAKMSREMEQIRLAFLAGTASKADQTKLFDYVTALVPAGCDVPQFLETCSLGSIIYAKKPGDGSAREQAASCQKVLGGWGNMAQEYATKRYRSNLINWGLPPFIISDEDAAKFDVESVIHIKDVKKAIASGAESLEAQIVGGESITLSLPNFTENEREIVLQGCLINYYASQLGA